MFFFSFHAIPKDGSNCAWNYHRAKKEKVEEGRADFVTKRISRVQNGTPLPTTSNLARLIIIFIEISDTTRTKLIGLSIIPPPNFRYHENSWKGEGEKKRERFILVPSIFLSVLCTWNTRFNFLSNIFVWLGFFKRFLSFWWFLGFEESWCFIFLYFIRWIFRCTFEVS